MILGLTAYLLTHSLLCDRSNRPLEVSSPGRATFFYIYLNLLKIDLWVAEVHKLDPTWG